jgi:putative ABC transport system permease protein
VNMKTLSFEWKWFEDLIQDLRYGVRGLAKHKAFTATALSALALAIGANTAIFSVVSGVILRPFPFAAQDRLVQVYGTPAERGEAIAWSDVEEFRTAGTSFDALAGYGVAARYLHARDGLERVMTVEAERGFFDMLGVRPLLGRTFGPDDSSNVAVAGESFWRRSGGDASILGKTLTLDGAPAVTIIGVMPESFQFPYSAASLLAGREAGGRTDLWILREPAPGQPRRGRVSLVTGRLKTGVALSTAESELSVILRRLETENPERIKGLGVRLTPLSDAVVSAPIRRSLFILFGAAGLVLLLACANVTNLFLVRVTMRGREVAARVALGASPFRLMRQLLTESLLLSLVGGAIGFVLAWWGTGQLMRFAAAQIPRSHEIGIDWGVFIFSLAVCTVTGALFGLAPALNAMRTGPHSILRDTTGHSTMSIRQRRFRDALVAAEVALAFVLAIGATLLIRELVRLKNTELGMVTGNVVTFHIGQQMSQGMDGRQFYEIADRVRQQPGVQEAGFTQLLPLQNSGWFGNSNDFRVRGRPAPESPLFTMELRYVTPGYFRALGISTRRGRAFTDQDNRGARPVVMINETLAARQFGSEDPVGLETNRGTIVGIVGDVRQVNLDRPATPEIYFPIAQNWSQVGELGMTLVVKTAGSPQASIDSIRAAIRDINPNLAIFNVRTMERVVIDSMSDFILYLSLMSAFAGLALFLASSGTYGVISYIAASRMREFAIRAALGARWSQVTMLVLSDAIRLTAFGLAIGITGAIAAAPLLRNLPVNVRGPDAVTIVPVAAAIAAIAILASVVPARRAAAADPMSTLRNE